MGIFGPKEEAHHAEAAIESLEHLEDDRGFGPLVKARVSQWSQDLSERMKQNIVRLFTGAPHGNMPRRPDVGIFAYTATAQAHARKPNILETLYNSRFESRGDTVEMIVASIPPHFSEIEEQFDLALSAKEQGDRDKARVKFVRYLSSIISLNDHRQGTISPSVVDHLRTIMNDARAGSINPHQGSTLRTELIAAYIPIKPLRAEKSVLSVPISGDSLAYLLLAEEAKSTGKYGTGQRIVKVGSKALAQIVLTLSSPNWRKKDDVFSVARLKKPIGKMPSKILNSLPITKGLFLRTKASEIAPRFKDMPSEDIAALIGYLRVVGFNNVRPGIREKYGKFIAKLEGILATRIAEEVAAGDTATAHERIAEKMESMREQLDHAKHDLKDAAKHVGHLHRPEDPHHGHGALEKIARAGGLWEAVETGLELTGMAIKVVTGIKGGKKKKEAGGHGDAPGSDHSGGHGH